MAVLRSKATQPEASAFGEMHSSCTRDCSSPSSTFSAMMSPDRTVHSSNHTRSPACFSRSASRRTRGLSFALWAQEDVELETVRHDSLPDVEGELTNMLNAR